MNIVANETIGRTNWERMYAWVRKAENEHRRAMIHGALAAVLVSALGWFAGTTWGIALLGGTAAATISLLPAWKRARDMVRVAPPGVELFRFCRAEVDAQIARAHEAVAMNGLMCSLLGVFAVWLWIHGRPTGEMLLTLAFGFGFLALAFNVRLRILPRLKRERADME